MPPKRKDTSDKATPALKRAKKDKIKLVPEGDQILKNLHFYFMRNDEKSGERKLRHNKAREYGAICETEFGDHVTHIIVDKDLSYSYILECLKLNKLPPSIIIVDQKYPGDCIEYRRLLEPNQFAYEVKGAPLIKEDGPLTPSTPTPQITVEPSTPNKSFASDTTYDSIIVPPTPSDSSGHQRKSRAVEYEKIKPVDRPRIPEEEEDEKKDVSVQRNATRSSSGSPERKNPRRQLKRVNSSPTPLRNKDALVNMRRSKTNIESVEDESTTDELSQIIESLPKEVDIDKFLDEDHDNSFDGSETASDYNSDVEESKAKRTTGQRKISRTNTNENWQDQFQCMKENAAIDAKANPNHRTIQILNEMLARYEAQNDHWRTNSYRKAIRTLKTQTIKIKTKEQAVALPNIGERLAEKIQEIVETDQLQRLEYAKKDPVDQIVELFSGVYGIGDKTARKLVAAGYTSLEDLEQRADLSDAQRNGIKYYHDLKKRIPREEVAEHGKIVDETLKNIDENAVTTIMGSYRRGKSDCGDIDIIITKEGACNRELTDILLRLVADLFEKGFLLCHLAMPNKIHSDGSKWFGISKVADTARRIDFLIVPPNEIGAALLYFTGDDIFNRSMRLLASKKGMRLNQRGLFDMVIRGQGRLKLNEGTLLESRSERKIFERLGVPYRMPHHRICS